MKTVAPRAQPPAAASPLKLALVFAVLFIAYQLPQGLGMRIMHSVPVMSALMLMFLPIAWLAQTFFPSVAEDILTRGFLMRAMPALSRRWMFVVASASLYVLNHIYRLSNGPSEWLALFCYGLEYGAALFYSRSLWAAIGLHWGWNFAGDFLQQLVPFDLVAPALQPWMSSAAHVLMLVVVVAVGVRAASGPQFPQVLAG